MKASRIAAIGLVAAAVLWMGSGHLFPPEPDHGNAAVRPSEAETKKPFRVAVTEVAVVPHTRRLVLSGRTEADRKVMIAARAGGVITELKVRRGSRVKKDDVIAVLSDEAREAQVVQARALYTQRKTELDAKRRLIETGALPRSSSSISTRSSRRRGFARRRRGRARSRRGARRDGIITEVPVEVGQAAFSMTGRRSRSSSPSTRCWRWSRSPNASSAASMRGARPRSAWSPARSPPAASASSPAWRARRPALTGSRSSAERRRHDPGRHHGSHAADDGGAGRARAALALTFVRRRPGVRTVGDDGKVAFVPVVSSRTSRATCG